MCIFFLHPFRFLFHIFAFFSFPFLFPLCRLHSEVKMASQISFLRSGWHKKLRCTNSHVRRSFTTHNATHFDSFEGPWHETHRMLGLSERPAGAPTGGMLVPGSAVKITGGNYKAQESERAHTVAPQSVGYRWLPYRH